MIESTKRAMRDAQTYGLQARVAGLEMQVAALAMQVVRFPLIMAEIYRALERLDASPDLLSIIGSYGDTLADEEVLNLLKEWNETGKVIHERQ